MLLKIPSSRARA